MDMPHGGRSTRSPHRWMIVAIVASLALHFIAVLGTPRMDLAWVYEQPTEPALQVEMKHPAAPVARPVQRPRPVAPRPVPKAAAPLPAVATMELAPVVAPVAADASALVTAAATPPAEAAAPPRPYPVRSARLVYELYYGDSATLVGEVVQTWQLDRDRYVAQSAAEAVGFASLFFGGGYVQRSEGRLGPEGFIPERYTTRDERKQIDEQASFHWEEGSVEFQRPGKQASDELVPGTQDPLSVVHQLYFLQPLGHGVQINVATTRRANLVNVENLGTEDVEVPAGETRALHIKQRDMRGTLTEVWLDPQRAYLPVRIYTVNRNGHILDQRLREAAIEFSEG